MLKIITLFIIGTLLTYNVHYQGRTFYNSRIEQGKTTPKIFDIGMKYIPNVSDNQTLTVIADIIPLFLPFILLRNTPQLKNFVYMSTYILLIRYIFLNLTILPKDKSCKDESFTIKNIIVGHCYDKIFSGHFATVYLLGLFLYEYKIVNNIWLIGGVEFLYAMLLIGLRYHYTIDIAVAIVVTQLIFSSFK